MGNLARFKGEEFDCVVVDPATMEEVGRVRAFVAQAEDRVGYTLKLLKPTTMYPDTLLTNVDDPGSYLYCGNYKRGSDERRGAASLESVAFLENIVRTGEFKVPGELGICKDLFDFNGWDYVDFGNKFQWGDTGVMFGCAF